MFYDDYLDLREMDVVPFVDQRDDSKSVSKVVYPLRNPEGSVLYMWINSERDGFYLYLTCVAREMFWYRFTVDGMEDGMKKILLMPKYGRGSRSAYYSAGLKASIFAKDIVDKILPAIEVDWSRWKTFEHKMSVKPFGTWQDVLGEEAFYFFDEKAIWEKSGKRHCGCM